MPATSPTPAKPARPPVMSAMTVTMLEVFRPAYLAALEFSPTTRSSKPSVVRVSRICNAIASRMARINVG